MGSLPDLQVQRVNNLSAADFPFLMEEGFLKNAGHCLPGCFFEYSFWESVGSRKRGLKDYSDNLGLDLLSFFRRTADLKGSFSWVDLGCGSGNALEEAASCFASSGICEGALQAAGYDLILPTPGAGSRNYGISFFEGDISAAKFPFAPDLVTLVHVLQWNKNPLEIISNAMSQIEEGGILAFTSPYSIILKDKENLRKCTTPLFESEVHIPGFGRVRKTGRKECSSVALRRGSGGYTSPMDIFRNLGEVIHYDDEGEPRLDSIVVYERKQV